MAAINVTLADGRHQSVEATDGLTLMEVLRPLEIGILGTCGGSAICATCQVWVDESWFNRLPPLSDDETDALDVAPYTRATSRLSCQLRVGPQLDGLHIAIPHATVVAAVAASASQPAAVAAEPASEPEGDPASAAEAPPDPAVAGPSSDRTRLRRYNWLAKYDRDAIHAILDAGIVCQVGYIIDGAPYVTPTNYWRIDDYLYWHGSSASRMLKTQQKGIAVCFTVTHLDGIVFSRAAFNHNVKFRSVMAFGQAEFCEEDVKRRALEVFTDRLAPGLWDYARPPAEQEWKATKVIRMKLDEVSAKVADGLPDEDAEDLDSDRWAGSVPLRLVQLPPVPDPKLKPGIATPSFVTNFRYGA